MFSTTKSRTRPLKYDATTTFAYRRTVEAAAGGGLKIPSAGTIFSQLRAAHPELLVRSNRTSARYVVELVLRLGAVWAGMIVAVSYESWWVVAALVVAQAFNYFGAVTLIHDAVHGSLFTNRRVNTTLGLLLGSLTLLRFLTLRRTHLLHHKYNQAAEDPKGNSALRNKSSIVMRGIRWWYARIYTPAPAFLQSLMVAAAAPAIAIAMLTTNQEFGPLTSLRMPQARTDVAIHVAFWTLLFFVLGPTGFLLVLAPLPIAYVVLSGVFLTHVHRWMLAPREHRSGEHELMIFNINNLSMGRVIDRLAFNFPKHHVEHHLFPSLPWYRLEAASVFVQREYGQYLLPTKTLDLDYLKRGILIMAFDRVPMILNGREVLVTPALAYAAMRYAAMDPIRTGAQLVTK